MNEDRTIYTINDEIGEKTTITLDKWVADILQVHFTNVHLWIQETYDRVALSKPHLGRRQKGDLVRALSIREAMNSPAGVELLKDF